MHTLRFVLALHNHQPVGNFDEVFEAAYHNCYRPFLELLADNPDIPVSWHNSGCLMEWLAEHHPEYVEQLRDLVARGQVEILGGGFYEPILSMIPARDRRGQIRQYSDYLTKLLECNIRGMWVPERVWEQRLVSDIVTSGIEYTVLDDFHFKCTGLGEADLFGYYLTEDEGQLLKVFPNSERLRYLIPWADPDETIGYARQLAEKHPNVLLVIADDGEKFGSWPKTHKHVFEEGWLRRMFDALRQQRNWLKLSTFSQALDETPPIGKVYLPDASYREMTEWALPAAELVEYEQLNRQLEQDGRWQRLRRFVRGGFWSNFKVKYPETDEMYCRMLEVSRRLEQMQSEIRQDGGTKRSEWLAACPRDLYRGQCNCAYWHGKFGGVYLPHLRQAVFAHLIAADNALEHAAGRIGPWVEAVAGDFNLDARQEVRLANDRLVAYLAPGQGGQLYELDIRAVPMNLLATLTRGPEAYHQMLTQQGCSSDKAKGGTGNRLRFKQPGLSQKLRYDQYRRKSLIDHLFPSDVSLAQLTACNAPEQGDFVEGVYQARIRRHRGRVEVVMSRSGAIQGRSLKITKTVTLAQESSALEIRYMLEEVPSDFPFQFAVELAFAGLASNAADRYYYTAPRPNLGQLQTELDHEPVELFGLVDGWLGIDIAIHLSRPARIWTFPVQTVSNSEEGIDLVYQNSIVVPHWHVQPDGEGRWRVDLVLAVDTTAAEMKRRQKVTV